MDELINQISSRTGISNDQAKQAVEMAMGFVKSKLPEPFASQVDGLLSGSGGGGAADVMGAVQDKLGDLGGMFGK
jgi:hypothetical protein